MKQVLLVAVMAFSFIPVAALAQSDVYTVEKVKVDIRGQNPVEARDQALEQAQMKAFSALSKSLNDGAEIEADSAKVSSLLKDFEITDEKIAAERYAATYTMRFNKPAMQQFMIANTGGAGTMRTAEATEETDMTGAGTPGAYPTEDEDRKAQEEGYDGPRYSEMFDEDGNAAAAVGGDEPLLLLTYWREGGDTVLWGGDNRWMNTWQEIGRTAESDAFVLPIGDLADVRDIGDRLPEDRERIARLLARYQVNQGLVLVGQQTSSGISTEVYRANATNGLEFIKVVESPRGPANDPYKVAAGQVMAEMRGGFPVQSEEQEVPVAQANKPVEQEPQRVAARTLTVEGRFDNARQWLEMKRTLESIRGVNSVNVVSLRPSSAVVQMNVSRSVEQLQQSLMNNRLYLQEMASSPGISGVVPDYRLSYGGA